MQQEKPLAAVCEALCLLGEDCLLPSVEVIVPPRQLICPSGKRQQRKRALLRQLDAARPAVQVVELCGANLDVAFGLERQWQTGGDEPQQAFVRRCFRFFEQLSLMGVLLVADSKPIGYSIASPCGEQGGYILAMRALPSPAGVTAALYRASAQQLIKHLPNTTAINLGFVGGEQEWQIRLSYQTNNTGEGNHAG